MTFDVDAFVAFDLETHLIQAGLLTPPVVCGSYASASEKGLVVGKKEVIEKARSLFLERKTFVGANIAFDFGCLACEDPSLIPLIFEAYANHRVYDVQIAQALDAIYHGHLGKDPRTDGPTRDPITGERSGRYSLAIVVDLVLGRSDAKKNDFWRQRYALLQNAALQFWPGEAKQYPIDDAVNTLEAALAQVQGIGSQEPLKNLQDMPFQCEAAWALHLGAIWGFRTSFEKVSAIQDRVEKAHEKIVEKYKALGFIRSDGKEDSSAVKKAVAKAYGATGTCKACKGTGKVLSEKTGKPVICKKKVAGSFACGGTGLDLSTAPLLPKTDSGDVSTSRDSLMESADEDLSEYGENESDKIRTTYVPYLKRGLDKPLTLRPNILVATGRTSYSDPIQQFPKKGGVRECIEARPGYVFCSVDYSAGELCTLSQICLWIVGYSKMAEAINRTGNPGVLHSLLGASILGIGAEDFLKRLEAKDKVAKDYRQAAKCFHPDTEILTRHRGWVRIADLTLEDEVASVVPHEMRPSSTGSVRDRSTGRYLPSAEGKNRSWWKKSSYEKPNMEIVWTKPIRLTTRKATEGLLHLANEGINLRVTPDHRMLAYGSTSLLKTVEAKDLKKQRGWFNAGFFSGGSLEIDERLLRLAVAVQADGSYSSSGVIRLGFLKERKISRLRSLLKEGEYRIDVYLNGKCKPTTWFTLSHNISSEIAQILGHDKTLPWSWIELKPNLRVAVIEECAYWDAHTGGKLKCYRYTSTNKKNGDVLQALASITERKATFGQYSLQHRRNNSKHAQLYELSVKRQYHTRGDNLKADFVPYFDDVYCLTVPSGCVLVRDQGVPVITHQCGNFGLPGGMGAPKFVISNRKKNVGSTKGFDGVEYAGIRFCILLGNARKCGVDKITEWKGRPTSPVCRHCVIIVQEVLKPAFFESWPEVREYHDWVSRRSESESPFPCFGAGIVPGGILRERGRVGFCDGANNGFQALMSDIAKSALRRVTRECYLKELDSPLYGSRIPAFFHDEIFAEIPEEMSHLAGPRISQIMVEEGRRYAPGVAWHAEPALMREWNKEAEPVYDSSGKLCIWEPRKA